jgi:hypothetical protein
VSSGRRWSEVEERETRRREGRRKEGSDQIWGRIGRPVITTTFLIAWKGMVRTRVEEEESHFISTSFSIPKEPNSYSAISTRGHGKGTEDDEEEVAEDVRFVRWIIGRLSSSSWSEICNRVCRNVSIKSKV